MAKQKNRPKNVLEWFKIYSQGKIHIPHLEDDDSYNRPKYKYIIQQVDPKTNEVIAEFDTLPKKYRYPEGYDAVEYGFEFMGYKWRKTLELTEQPTKKTTQNSYKNKEILQIDPNTFEVVARYDNAAQTPFEQDLIYKAIRSKNKSNGYYWQRVKIGDPPQPINPQEIQRNYKPRYIYQQVDPKTNEVIKEYDYIKDLPISQMSIHKCIKDPEKIVKHYKWKRILQPQ